MQSRLMLAIAPLVLAGGCATPGPVLNEAVGSIRSGVAAAQAQSQMTFDESNKIVLEQSVLRVIDDPSPVIAEKSFLILIDRETAAKWEESFGILDEYGAALQKLVDPARAQATGDALESLGNALNGPTIKADLSPGFRAAVSTFGQALVQAKAEKSAMQAMLKTDPAFNDVVTRMADALGRSNDEIGSLRNTMFGVWTNDVLRRLATEYAALRPGDPNRRKVADRYILALRARDAQMTSIAELRRSILALGEAHRAAANGRSGDAAFWIQRISNWLDDFKKRKAKVEGGEK